MTDLKIAVSNTGPVPDNQCALKDAILFAASQNETLFEPEDIVTAAQAFYAFLQDPTGNTPAAPPPSPPAVVPDPPAVIPTTGTDVPPVAAVPPAPTVSTT